VTQPVSVSFSSRIGTSLTGWLDPPLVDWAGAAARVFERQLEQAGGACHRQIAEIIGQWLGMTSVELDGLGSSLDLLQVAFDLADNLADADEDKKRGKEKTYEGIPRAVQLCLPAYLVATSHQQLARTFGHRPAALVDASTLIHGVLGAMMTGQGCEDPAIKARLVSGAQGRLLCLPAWLCAPPVPDEMRTALLRWAEAWGTSWELQFAYQDDRTAAARARWIRSLEIARQCWPTFGPFASGGPLSPEHKLPCVC
jgi:hypothetical protein